MDEYEILHCERDQSLNSTGTDGLHASRRNVALQALAKARPEAATPRQYAAEQQHRSPANGNR